MQKTFSQFISSQVINHSELVSVVKCPQKSTKPNYTTLTYLKENLPSTLKVWPKLSRKNKMPPTESEQHGENLCLHKDQLLTWIKIKLKKKMQPALRNCQLATLECKCSY